MLWRAIRLYESALQECDSRTELYHNITRALIVCRLHQRDEG